eukprot:1475843-Amphidinium_carterae.2
MARSCYGPLPCRLPWCMDILVGTLPGDVAFCGTVQIIPESIEGKFCDRTGKGSLSFEEWYA